jgi:protein-S-isoprenylcysteine O-methyltransferase Ste14
VRYNPHNGVKHNKQKSMNDTKTPGLFRHLGAVLMPFTVTIIIPALIFSGTQSISFGWGLTFPALLLPIMGFGLIGAGLALVVMTVKMFVQVGKGTLAPWDPTRRLVVTGVYRHVRNPMISGVFSILLGESVVFGSPALLMWTLIFAAVNMVYIPFSEEPGLQQRFGVDYQVYTRHVPRWLPRRTPWSPSDASANSS